jgi:hypothetical protein
MVMDAGQLIEFDHPAILLENPESIFYDLVKETGMFEILVEQARSSLDKQRGRQDVEQVDHTSAQNGGVRLDSDAFTDVRL